MSVFPGVTYSLIPKEPTQLSVNYPAIIPLPVFPVG